MDEGFFERVDDKEVIDEKKDQLVNEEAKLKRGRGSERQTKVLVMVESKPMGKEATKGKPDRKVGYLKMKVMEDRRAETIGKVVEKSVEKTAEVLTDGYRGYSKLKSILAAHPVIVEPDKVKSAKLFPWANRTISNAKKILLGIHHNCLNSKFMKTTWMNSATNSTDAILVRTWPIDSY